MLIQIKRAPGDRYIVRGRWGGTAFERIGFVRQDKNHWNAVDTFMEQSQDFKTRRLAVEWLAKIAEERKDEIWE